MRSVSPERLNGVDALLQQAIQDALDEANRLRRDGDALTVDVELIGDRPSGEIPETTPLVQRAIAATRHFEFEPSLGIGSTNSNTPIALGIPAVTIGGGGVGGGAHSLGEWFLNERGALGIKRVLLLLVAEAGMAVGR